MKKTLILWPLPVNICLEELNQYTAHLEKIVDVLRKMPKGERCTHTFKSFLDLCGITYDTYLLAIRSNLSKTTIFLKRAPNATYLNQYSLLLLFMWRGNIDTQYILDIYSVVMYITAYMTKPIKGVSKVAHEMKKPAEADPSNKTVEQLRKVGSTFVRCHEIGIQKACCLLIRQQLNCITRTVVFLNTNLPDKRNYMLEPMATIEAMSDDRTDSAFKNQQIRYGYRPISLKSMCLADFMSQYWMQ